MEHKLYFRGALALLIFFSLLGCGRNESSDLDVLQEALEQYTQQVNIEATKQGIEGLLDAKLEGSFNNNDGAVALTYGFPAPSPEGLTPFILSLEKSWLIANPDIIMPKGFMTIWLINEMDDQCGVIYSINRAHPQAPLIKQHCL
jgi:hypothetical protein